MLSNNNITSDYMLDTSSIEKKMKAKKTAQALVNRFKCGSPKLNNLIREKCRLRMKDNRQNRFQISRNLLTEEKREISKFLMEEISDIDASIELQDLVLEEMLKETDNWFIEELENELKIQDNYLVEINEELLVFCPICQKSLLKSDRTDLKCKCGVKFQYKSLEAFSKKMNKILEEHENNCIEKLKIFLEPNVDNSKSSILNVVCTNCNYYDLF